MAAQTSAPSLPVGELFSKGWEIFKKKWAFIYLIGIITFIANMIPSFVIGNAGDVGTVVMILLQIVQFVWNSGVAMGGMYLGLKISRGEDAQLSDFLTPLSNLGNYILGTILVGLIVMVGFILLIVPGIIWSLKYMFVPFLLVDKGMGPQEALKASSNMTDGVKWQLFAFLLACVGLNILGMIPLFLGLLITIPVTTMAQYVVYNMLLPRAK